MLETVREFAHDALVASDEEAAAHGAHADYFLTLAERAAPGITGPVQASWFERLEADLPNLRAAMSWLRDHDRMEQGLRIAAALGWFWYRRNREREGWQWFESFLSRPMRDDALRSKALAAAGTLAVRLGDHQQALKLHEQSLELCRKTGDHIGIATALRGLGDAATGVGDLARAEAVFAESLRLFGELHAPWDAAVALHWSGIAAYARGDYTAAANRFGQALALYEHMEDEAFANWMRGNLAWVALVRGDYDHARSAYGASLDVAWEHGDTWWVSWCLTGIGGLAAEQRMYERAARLYGAAEALRIAAGAPLRPSVQVKYDRLVTTCRAAMGEAAWSAAFEQGQAISLDQAVAEARDILGTARPPSSATPGAPSAYGLTPREREVLRFLVGGRSDRDIAAALFIAHRTAQDHVSHIIAKMGVLNRTEAAAVAVRDGLV